MKIGKTVISAIDALMVWLVYQLVLPPLSLKYIDGFFFIAVVVTIVVANIVMWVSKEDVTQKVKIILKTGVAIIIILTIGVVLIEINTVNNITEGEQIGEVKKVRFHEMITQIDTAQIPIVDEALAAKQAEKKISEDVALGSSVELGDATIQRVNNEIKFVFPLEYTGFFKQITNKAIPGYITVSACNQNKVEYVTEVDGEKIEIRYSMSAFFEKDLKRHIRNEGFRTQGLMEYTFEINDRGRPYWVVTTVENRIPWLLNEATGVITVDSQNGETKWYGLGEIPEWVDIVQPKSTIESQIDNWGEFVHEGHTGKIKRTGLMQTVFVNGDCYYFTGMTSVEQEDSCVGFIMINARDKEAQICYMSGATESTAMIVAEVLDSGFGYLATKPLPLNINGVPTYVMTLKDKKGSVKLYSMVNIENYSITAKGSSLQETSRAYIQAIARNNGSHVVASNEAYGYTYEGVVKRISSVVEDGSTSYYMVVEGEENKIFMASYMVSDELSITRDGDTVKISYIDDKNGTVDVMGFDNVAFATSKSEAQERREAMDEGTSALDSKYNQAVEVNPEMNEKIWNSLTDEEKAKILGEFSRVGKN